jgi:hypothetical protein
MYKLAERTATYKIRGVSHEQARAEILSAIKDYVVPFESVGAENKENPEFVEQYQRLLNMQQQIRSDDRNTIVIRDNSN